MIWRRGSMKYRHDRPQRRGASVWLWFVLVALLGVVAFRLGRGDTLRVALPPAASTHSDPGDVISEVGVTNYDASQAFRLAKENYGASTLPALNAVTKVTFTYRSKDTDGTPLTIYARAYLPRTMTTKTPIFAFAPGTTGIGDRCAPSLEQPAVANWANYDSHMMMYASQGYAAVTTDYEGMRDPSRIEHYMVGELEGRAVLDSIRALKQLPQVHNDLATSPLFLGGYSQGGHAAFWADQIATEYAPELKVTGVVGFGPVMDVKQTLDDVTRAANINWFGPYVFTSYMDYYQHNYPLEQLLLPQWTAHLSSDVQSHCIDTDLSYWGHDPAKVYAPDFIQTMLTGQYTGIYEQLGADLDRNQTGSAPTRSAKRINAGDHDNVLLPPQQQAAFARMCSTSRGPVQLAVYAGATHYDTMVRSLHDTLTWMQQLARGEAVKTTCPPAA